MGHKKVNPSLAYSIPDSRSGGAVEGLRLLARMVARRLAERTSGPDAQCHPIRLPAGRVDKKASLQSPGRVVRKQAATPSDCKPDILDAVMKEEGNGA